MNSILESVNSRLPDWIRVGRGTVYLRTKRIHRVLEYASRFKRSISVTRPLSIGLAWFTMFLMTVLTVLAGYVALTNTPEPRPTNDPVNIIAIPGVNDFIPMDIAVYFLISLLAAAVFHEFAHGVAAKSVGVAVKEAGFFAILGIPMGAYVKPDPDEMKNAGSFDRMFIASAGIFANFLLFLVGVALFYHPAADPVGAAAEPYASAVLTGVVDGNALQALHPITHLASWMAFLNLNLVLVNSLPVIGLDGGHNLQAAIDSTIGDWRTIETDITPAKIILGAVSLLVVGSFALALALPRVVG